MGKRSGLESKQQAIEHDPLELMDSLFQTLPIIEPCFDENITNPLVGVEKSAEVFKHRPLAKEFRSIQSHQYLANVLEGLPKPQETWHILSNSRFNFWSFVPTCIEFLGGKTDLLYCATWTTNNQNTSELIKLLDLGKIDSIVFVVGRYFQVREQAVYNFLATQLMQRKQKLIVGEHHAKILLLQNGDNYITIESSANLCANPRTEQFTYSNDKGLFEFYQNWFNGLVEK